MENFHSLEIRGPILPHAVQNLCSLLEQSLDEFTATFAVLDSTRPFSLVTGLTVDNLETNESLGKLITCCHFSLHNLFSFHMNVLLVVCYVRNYLEFLMEGLQ